MGIYLDKYLEQFHQDILSINPSMNAAIRDALRGLSKYEREALNNELKDIYIDQNLSFLEIWNNSKSPFRLGSERAAREILSEILDAL